MGKSDSTPPPPTQSKARRSPTDVQRDRLTERIRRFEVARTVAVKEALDQISESAERELAERRLKAKARIEARFAARIEPLQRMLSALTSPDREGSKGAG